jgi:hypothetical protein
VHLKSDLIRRVAFDGSGLIRGVAFDGAITIYHVIKDVSISWIVNVLFKLVLPPITEGFTVFFL